MNGVILAIDIGGSKIAAALVTFEGTIRHERYVLTPQQGLESLLASVYALVDELLACSDVSVDGIGLAVPGIVNSVMGTAVGAANLPWQNTPLVEIMTRRSGLKTILGNDADGAALAEKWFGMAKVLRRFICLTIGTGIGGGVVLDGKLLSGANGSGCEIGHMIIDPKGPHCRCGSRGCLEALAAGPAIAKRMEALHGQSFTAKDVINAARDGNMLARKVLSDTAANLAVAVINLWRLFEPQMIVLGGGVTAAGDLLKGPLVTHLERLSPQRLFPSDTVQFSTIHRESSVLAAAALFLEAGQYEHASYWYSKGCRRYSGHQSANNKDQ